MKRNNLQTLTAAALLSLAPSLQAARPTLFAYPTATYHANGSGSTGFFFDVEPRYEDANEARPENRVKTASVEDFHVCMPGTADDATAEKIEATLEPGGAPKGWTRTVAKDQGTGRWCINFYRNGGDRLTDTTRFSVGWNRNKTDAAGNKVPCYFKFNGGDDTLLVVTNSTTVGETDWRNSTLYNSKEKRPRDKIRGPEIEAPTAYVEPASSEPTPSNDARLIITGLVTSGSEAVASVVNASGATLSGVVVDVNGERHVTDTKGRILFAVAAGATLAASLPGRPGSEVRVPVVPPSAPSTAIPAIQSAPTFTNAGQTATIGGTGFSGAADANTVTLGGKELDVLASSPSQLIVATPSQTPLGPQDLTVTTENGSSRPRKVTVVQIRMESRDTALRTGQKGQAQLVVEGTTEPVTLTVTNLAPQTVSLDGRTTATVRTSGGSSNHAKIDYRAVRPGAFQIAAVIAEPHH